MKEAGVRPVDCFKAIRDVLNISIKSADQVDLNSKAWHSIKDRSLALRDSFSDFVENLSDGELINL